MRVIHLQSVTLEESLEDGALEDLDDLELSPPLHLEALQLREAAVEVEDGVALLEPLALLLGGWQDHELVGTVHLEEYGDDDDDDDDDNDVQLEEVRVLLAHLVVQAGSVLQLVVLGIIGNTSCI